MKVLIALDFWHLEATMAHEKLDNDERNLLKVLGLLDQPQNVGGWDEPDGYALARAVAEGIRGRVIDSIVTNQSRNWHTARLLPWFIASNEEALSTTRDLFAKDAIFPHQFRRALSLISRLGTRLTEQQEPLTLAQCAAIAGKTPRQIQRWVEKHIIPAEEVKRVGQSNQIGGVTRQGLNAGIQRMSRYGDTL